MTTMSGLIIVIRGEQVDLRTPDQFSSVFDIIPVSNNNQHWAEDQQHKFDDKLSVHNHRIIRITFRLEMSIK